MYSYTTTNTAVTRATVVRTVTFQFTSRLTFWKDARSAKKTPLAPFTIRGLNSFKSTSREHKKNYFLRNPSLVVLFILITIRRANRYRNTVFKASNLIETRPLPPRCTVCTIPLYFTKQSQACNTENQNNSLLSKLN